MLSMNMYDKEKLLNIALQNGGYKDTFKIERYDDLIVFRAYGNIDEVENAVEVAIILDDRIYTSIVFYFGNLNNSYLRTNLLELMNKKNYESLTIKYSMDDNNLIQGRSVMIMNDFNFDADSIVDHFRIAYGVICEDYKDLRQYL